MKSVFGTPIRFNGPLSSQQLMTARAPQPPTMICDCGRQYTVAEIERQLISMESGTIGESGRVNSRFSTKVCIIYKVLLAIWYSMQFWTSSCSTDRISYPMEICCSFFGRRSVEVVGELGEMTIFTCDFGTAVLDTIFNHTRLYESHHVTCEAVIKPAMVSKRLTASIQPLGIDVD
nr:hypothetical protein HmN_000352400 [Hymenolepis microstoma]